MPLLLIALGIITPVLWHRYLPRYVLASWASAATTVVIIQIVDFVGSDVLNPFWWLLACWTFPPALLFAFLIGLPFRNRRKRGVADAA